MVMSKEKQELIPQIIKQFLGRCVSQNTEKLQLLQPSIRLYLMRYEVDSSPEISDTSWYQLFNHLIWCDDVLTFVNILYIRIGQIQKPLYTLQFFLQLAMQFWLRLCLRVYQVQLRLF